MKWNKLTEMLPPIIREEEEVYEGMFDDVEKSTIRTRTSKPVLLRSPKFEEFCKNEWVDTQKGFVSRHLMGVILVEDVVKGMTGDPDDDHRICVHIIGMDNTFAVKGNDDTRWCSKYFANDPDIEWLDMDELDQL